MIALLNWFFIGLQSSYVGYITIFTRDHFFTIERSTHDLVVTLEQIFLLRPMLLIVANMLVFQLIINEQRRITPIFKWVFQICLTCDILQGKAR